jgi:hypothetical protein
LIDAAAQLGHGNKLISHSKNNAQTVRRSPEGSVGCNVGVARAVGVTVGQYIDGSDVGSNVVRSDVGAAVGSCVVITNAGFIVGMSRHCGWAFGRATV